MVRYETLFLTVSEITKDEIASVEKQFGELVRAGHGQIISFERWGKYRLAYPIDRNDYGVYFLVRFEVDRAYAQKLLQDIRSFFTLKFNNVVKRSLSTALDSEASLHYQRPESLEETPHDVDVFLRKNKMEGLINKSPRREGHRYGASAPAAVVEGQQESEEIETGAVE